MPVTKNSGNDMKMSQPEENKCCGNNHFMMHKHHGCHNSAKRVLLTLVGILLVYMIVWMGTLVRNNIKKYYYVGQADRSEKTISFDAEGKVQAVPDIAVTTVGMLATAKTVEEAQQTNTKVMNNLIAELKKFAIDDKDIQTSNYNINPKYNYTTEGGQELVGYEVSQSVTVKIRNLDNASKVLSVAGQVGANNVSGLQFTIDDPEVYRNQAREQALKKVYAKADSMARMLGVKLVRVVGYNESGGNNYPIYTSMSFKDLGMGGEMATPPTIEAGTNDVVVNVSVTFEIR